MANILFVFEGEKTELKIFEELNKILLNENDVVTSAFCKDIYQLFNEIEDDPDLDTFILVKEQAHNKEQLSDFKRKEFAEIYLFFDYDGQDPLATDEKIDSLLSHFNEETNQGKLYISYPMIESLKHIPKQGDLKNVTVASNVKIEYKNYVITQIEELYKSPGNYTRETWVFLICEHVRKLNYIVNDSYSIPKELISQTELFQNQKEKFIVPNSLVSVICSFPVFLCDQYGIRFMKSLAS